MRSAARPPARNTQNSQVLAGTLRLIAVFSLLVSVRWLTSCAGVSTAASASKQPSSSITVTVSPSSATVTSSGTKQFTATVTNTSNTAVTWYATVGTISSTGLFQAPSVTANTVGVVTAASAADSTKSASVSITITPAPPPPTLTVTTSSLSSATAGSTYSATLAASGGQSPYTWTLASGTLPSGITLQSSGSLSGTTSQWGQFVFATQVADASTPQQTATQSLTLTVNNIPVAIPKSTLASATAGTAFAVTLSASGGQSPYAWTLVSGSLPSGINLQSAGSLSGTTSQTGQFPFTVQAADSSSPQQTSTQSFTLVVNSATVGGNTIALTFFGADFNSGVVWPPTDGLSQTASLNGMRLWDDNVKWSDINTADGVYDWTPLDAWLSKAQSSNMDVLYTFGATPQFAAPTTPPPGCFAPGSYSCAAPVDVNTDGTGTDAYFSAFVTALVAHAAGRISYYELWNEPDALGFWSGTTAQLVRMGQDAASIIRSQDPSAKILSPSAHGQTMSTWFDGYIAAGGTPNFDIVNVHMRGVPTLNAQPEEFLTVYGQVETELQARSLTSLPLWDDEWGIELGELTDPDMLEGFNARSAILRASVGLQRQYIYQWDSIAPYGLQGSGNGTAWDQVASWLVGHSISACVANGTVYTCQLDNGVIVWDTAQSCSNGVCTTSNYTYPSNYLWYHDVLGNRTALSGGIIAIGDKPILLSSQ